MDKDSAIQISGSKRVPLTKKTGRKVPAVRHFFLGTTREHRPSFVRPPGSGQSLTAPNKSLQISIGSSQVLFGVRLRQKDGRRS